MPGYEPVGDCVGGIGNANEVSPPNSAPPLNQPPPVKSEATEQRANSHDREGK